MSESATLHSYIESSCTQVSFTRNSDVPLSLAQLRKRIETLRITVSESEQRIVDEEAPALAIFFAGEELSLPIRERAWLANEAGLIINVLKPELLRMVVEHGANSNWSRDAAELAALRIIELLTGAFLLQRRHYSVVHQDFVPCWNDVWKIYIALPDLDEAEELTPKTKALLLEQEIRRCNKEGWPTIHDGDLIFRVEFQTNFRQKAEEFFELQAHVSAHEAWRVLSDCVEVAKLNPAPKGFDPFWKPRRGVNPTFLFRYWGDIYSAIESAESLAR